MRRISRLAAAFWFAVIALTAGAFEQNQLAYTVVTVALAEAGGADLTAMPVGHTMPDGTFMAGAMPGMIHGLAGMPGHTHMGHADCEVCGALAAMAAFMLPSLGGLIVPPSFALPRPDAPAHIAVIALQSSPYASRAPPITA